MNEPDWEQSLPAHTEMAIVLQRGTVNSPVYSEANGNLEYERKCQKAIGHRVLMMQVGGSLILLSFFVIFLFKSTLGVPLTSLTETRLGLMGLQLYF